MIDQNEKFFEPLSARRFIVQGSAYTAMTKWIGDGADASRPWLRFDLSCCRCGAGWGTTMSPRDLHGIYVAIPVNPSPVRLTKIEHVRNFVARVAGGHVCMPRGYTSLPSSLLVRIDKDAPRSEQLEALSAVIGELAIEAQRGAF